MSISSQKFITAHRQAKRAWILSALLLAISAAGWLRLDAALANWQWLLDYQAAPGPLYLASSGGIWGIATLGALVCLWLRRLWSLRLSGSLVIACALAYWIDRLVLSQPGTVQANAPFMAGITVLGLFYTYLILSTQREMI